jgi:hypothetical protein
MRFEALHTTEAEGYTEPIWIGVLPSLAGWEGRGHGFYDLYCDGSFKGFAILTALARAAQLPWSTSYIKRRNKMYRPARYSEGICLGSSICTVNMHIDRDRQKPVVSRLKKIKIKKSN